MLLHLTLADAILLATLVVAIPSYSFVTGRRISSGVAYFARKRSYARTMISWWLIVAATLLVWLHFGRSPAALGLTVPFDVRSLLGALLCVLVLAYFSAQWRTVARLPEEKRERVRAGLGATAAILPRTNDEYAWFLCVALTAGICEEILYRGYFFVMLGPAITVWGAMAASALIFGFGHAYQGPRGIVRTAAAGIFLGLVYAVTGSLLWPVVLHFTINLSGGTVGYRLLREESSP